jgi:cyanophycinase
MTFASRLAITPLLACAGAVLILLTENLAAATRSEVPLRGRLLIVGGGPLPERIIDRFVEISGGSGHSFIAIFPQASEYKDAGIELAKDFEKRGARAKRVLVTRAEADRADAAQALSGVTGVWFGGGDQSRLTAVLAGTRMETAIHELYEKGGAAVGGTSAGAAVMSASMITGDERFPGGSRASSVEAGPSVTIARDNVVLEEGLAFLPGAIVDQHFVRRRRHSRLISAVLESPERLGVGIDESTALEVDPDGCWRVLGDSVAVIYDARRAMVGADDGGLPRAADIHVHVLPAGGWFDPSTSEVRLEPPLK